MVAQITGLRNQIFEDDIRQSHSWSQVDKALSLSAPVRTGGWQPLVLAAALFNKALLLHSATVVERTTGPLGGPVASRESQPLPQAIYRGDWAVYLCIEA